MSSESKSRRAAPKQESSGRVTGGKTPARPGAARPRQHRPLSIDSEQSARALLFGVTAAILVAAAAFIAIGYYVSVIKPRGRTVLQVDNIKISYSEMKRRMAHEYYTNTSLQNEQAFPAIPIVAYQNLLAELTLISRAEASDLGITIDEAEFDTALREKVGAAPNADEQAFAQSYRTALEASRLHDDEYRRLVRSELLERKVKEKLTAATPATVPQAKLEIIVTNEPADAQAAIDRVNAGEPWGLVARDLSLDSEVNNTGGIEDFQPQGAMPPAYKEYAFSAPVGQISEPLEDETGGTNVIYVVRVADRADRALSEEQKPAYEREQYSLWLENARTEVVVVDKWTSDRQAQADALKPIADDLRAKLDEQQRQQNQPQPTADLSVLTPPAETTAQAGTPAATPPAGAGTPAPTPPADAPTPVATAPADGG